MNNIVVDCTLNATMTDLLRRMAIIRYRIKSDDFRRKLKQGNKFNFKSFFKIHDII